MGQLGPTLKVVRGSSRDVVVSPVDANGDTEDLTTATGGLLVVASDVGVTPYVSKAMVVSGSTLTVTLTSDDTEGIPEGIQIGECEVTFSNGSSYRTKRFDVQSVQALG
jgi:hypothetical protein